MGRMSSECEENEITASHFSHPHPLNLISHHAIPNSSPNYSCSACKLKPSGMIYSCTICTFFLHKNCFQMPRKITHPSHKDHAFDLLPKPAYSDGAYSCDLCNEAGTGFVYHCKPCGIDLHTLCAATPLSLATPLHAHHLHLHFQSPYPDKRFRCDVCSRLGSNHWLYRCGLCGFDAHLKCVGASAPSPAPPICNPLQPAAAAAAAPFAAVGIPAASPNLAAFSANRQQSDRLTQLQDLIQVIQNNNAAVTPGGAAGFGGGGSGLPQLTQLMSGLTSSGFVGGGGSGGGSGVPGLNAFGGGGGQQFLQALMNGGGGGGGQQFLQSLMNGGGGGGGGGADAIQSLLGGGGFDFLGGVGGFF